MAAKDALGRKGEAIAARHLVRSGLTIVERNWRCPQGEIDLVARDRDDLVFVEALPLLWSGSHRGRDRPRSIINELNSSSCVSGRGHDCT